MVCCCRAGRAVKAQAKVPHDCWQATIFIAALRQDRITTPWFIEGPINGEPEY
jgi:hypothetical protein